MSDVPPSEESLRQEIEALGKNLIGALRSAWEAPESKRLRDEMTGGLSDLGSTLKREADYLASHPATQQMKEDVGQFGEKIKAPEAQAAVRRELMSVLQSVNSELQKVIDRWSAAEADMAEPAGDETAPEHPADEASNSNPAE
jgi:hypothetical protein